MVMKRAKKRKLKLGFKLLFIILIIIVILFLFKYNKNNNILNNLKVAYTSSESSYVSLYDLEYNEVDKIYRGIKVDYYPSYKDKDNKYTKIKYNNKDYLILNENITSKEQDILKEKELYVRTSTTIYKSLEDAKIESYVKKGEKVNIIGYDKITDGVVNKYKIKYNDKTGYVYSKYLVKTYLESTKIYDSTINEYMSKMGDYLGGGSALNLDYYPYEKPKFKDNVMPSNVRALYINSVAIKNIDDYIALAKDSNINAFVIDIKDNTSPAYNSPVMMEYSKTNYDKAINNYEDYKEYVKKARDQGFYLIGRITTFKDSYYVMDHKETAIVNKNNEPFSHNGSYWPSAYNRSVWEFNVALAREAVTDIGFNEIQFDYVRFPDRTTKLELNGTINLNNTYGEEKASALQTFVMYACDSVHEVGGYVSIDVFGESASNYVTAYGQFWPAISNVADVISGMPYPDHFNAHEYGIKEVVWTVPYKILSAWGSSVKEKQDIIKTPAIVRTWIQTYNTTKEPKVVYDESKVSDQIKALYDSSLSGGFMTWNSGSSISKYKEVSGAFRKVYT